MNRSAAPDGTRSLVRSALEAPRDSVDQLRHLLDHLQAQVPPATSAPTPSLHAWVEAPARERPVVELSPPLRKLEILVVTRSATPALVAAACPGEARVRSDGGELLRAFINMVEDVVEAAARAHPGAGPWTVEVDVARRGERVVLEVWDEGAGMPEDVRAYLEGTQPVAPARPHGHGLGLGVVRRVVAEHGDRLEVARVGGHTCVRIELPAA